MRSSAHAWARCAVAALGAVVPMSAAPAQPTQCSLGQAANYSVFANGDVIPGDTTAGGIAAAGDVEARIVGGGISIAPHVRARRSPSSAGGNFIGHRRDRSAAASARAARSRA